MYHVYWHKWSIELIFFRIWPSFFYNRRKIELICRQISYKLCLPCNLYLSATLKRTSVSVNFDSITFLQTRSPASFITSSTLWFLYSVPSFEPFFPFTLVRPFSSVFNTESMSTATEPFALKTVTIWPNINSTEFESVVPRAFISSLSFRSRADAISVRLAVFPFSAISSTIFKVKATTAHNKPRQA